MNDRDEKGRFEKGNRIGKGNNGANVGRKKGHEAMFTKGNPGGNHGRPKTKGIQILLRLLV